MFIFLAILIGVITLESKKNHTDCTYLETRHTAFSTPSRNYCKLITVISFYSCFTLGKVLVTNVKFEEKRHGIDYQFNESNIMIAI